MKKYIILTAIFAAAFAGCKTSVKTGNASGTDSVLHSTQVAYVHLDSLMANYDMYNDLRGDYEQKLNKAQNDLTARGRKLERDVADFQEKIQKGLVTRATAAQMEEDLGRRQQSFMNSRDQLMAELGEEEQVLLNQIHYSIVDFLNDFNSDYRYAMIISTTGGGPILNANPAMNLTTIVAEGLNKEYASKKGKSQPKKDATDK